MKKRPPLSVFISLLVLCCIGFLSAQAQEENHEVAIQGQKYLDFKFKTLDKLNDRLEEQQKRMLNKLKKREARYANKLKKTDSVGYARYKQEPLTYDSISKLSNADSATVAAKMDRRKNRLTDSLKGIESFIQNKSGAITSSNPQLQQNSAQITQLQGQLSYRDYINQLIAQRTNNLKNISSDGSGVPGFTGIEKQVFYGKAKMNTFKEMEEDPSKLEDKALEYLEGTGGFSQSMSSAINGGPGSMQSLGGNATAAQLQQMGYQTKSQMQSSLQQKFGGNLGGLTSRMSDEVSQWQQKANSITSTLNDIKQTKQSLKQLKNINKPDFKVNPMRGLPFWKRITKQYSWQSSRASADGETPALLNLSAMAGYKQSPKLTYGLGILSSFGLGQSWTNLHFTFQGIGLQSYTNWTWQYGIGLYAGYERIYKQVAFTNTTESTPTVPTPTATPHNTGNYTESVLLGLTKTYKINNKWNGQVEALYDIYWQQEGLRSPIVLRFATISN